MLECVAHEMAHLRHVFVPVGIRRDWVQGHKVDQPLDKMADLNLFQSQFPRRHHALYAGAQLAHPSCLAFA